MPDLNTVRNAIEHSEDYLREAGGRDSNLELGSMLVAVTSEDAILAIGLKDDPRQRFLSVSAALTAVDLAMESIYGRRRRQRKLCLVRPLRGEMGVVTGRA